MTDFVCELPKNSREVIRFQLGEFKNHKFVDMRIYAAGPGEDGPPTKKGLAVSPHLWSLFRSALTKVEEAMIKEGWLNKEDLEPQTD